MKISIYTYWKLAKPRQFKQLQNTAPQALIDGANISTATWLYNIVLLENLASWILDPQSSKLKTQSSHFETRFLHLETWSIWASRREDRVLSFECQLNFWAVLLSSVKKWKMMWSTCREHGTKKNLSPPAGIEPMTFRTLVGCSNCYKGLVASWAIIIFKVHVWHASCPVVRKVVGSRPVDDSDFSLSWHVDHIIFHVIL